MTISACKSCRAPIIWVTTPTGKTMPLDAMVETMWLIAADGAQKGSLQACAKIAEDKAKKAWALLGEFAAGEELSREQQGGEALAEQCEEIAEAIRARTS